MRAIKGAHPRPHNAFDTHVNQADNHARLPSYTSDHIAAFLADMARIGRGPRRLTGSAYKP